MRTELRVDRKDAGRRLDSYLAEALAAHSRSRIQNLIRRGLVQLNSATPKLSTVVRANDTIVIEEPPVEIAPEARAEAIPLHILHEDDDLVVLNKPPGLVVHPGAGNPNRTLVNALLHHCHGLSQIGGAERPGIVHRLDKETSGCLVVAKNDTTHHDLSRQFAGRTVGKTYLALVRGVPRKPVGEIDAAIGRHRVHRQKMTIDARRGRAARTTYRVLASSNSVALMECLLHSGRTHQIRVHLQHLGHPILGDKVYGQRTSSTVPRQMLHAWRLEFDHPRTARRAKFEAPMPPDFSEALALAGIDYRP